MIVLNIVFLVSSAITFILVLASLPRQFEAWNTGTCLFTLWTVLGLVCYFVNSIIWRNQTVNWAPVWCDITTRVIVGLSVAIPATSLTINRRLYCLASESAQTVTKTMPEKFYTIMVDLSISISLPAIIMALQYIVQQHRFDIFEEIGCYPLTYNTAPAYPLVWMPPIPIGMVSVTYAVMGIRASRNRRSEFKETLSSNSNLNPCRFFCLMTFAVLKVLCCMAVAIMIIFFNATQGEIQPYISWENIHRDFSRVDLVSTPTWRDDLPTFLTVELSRWIIVVCGILFFALLGFANKGQKAPQADTSDVVLRPGHPGNFRERA